MRADPFVVAFKREPFLRATRLPELLSDRSDSTDWTGEFLQPRDIGLKTTLRVRRATMKLHGARKGWRNGAMKRSSFLSFAVSLLFAAAIAAPAYAEDASHDFARWEQDIAAFERSDRATPPPSNGMLFIGSSTILLWKTLAEDLPGKPVINRGFGGSEIADSTYFADRIVIPYAPRLIFLRAGGNDIHAGKKADQVFEDFKAFGAKVHGSLPNTKVIYISLSPSIARWKEAAEGDALNAKVKEYTAATPGFDYLETADMVMGADGTPRPELFVDDKLHFNAAGYQLLAERVRSYLAKEEISAKGK